MWEQNNDDGWYHVTLPFDFNWFGATERIITIGTNGVLTFGTAQLPYGSSEPVRSSFLSANVCTAAHDSALVVIASRYHARMVTFRATEMTTRQTARCLPRASLLLSGQT